jgi:proline dehydrogenase
MMRTTLLALSRSRRLAAALPRYGFARRAVRRFMPGEDLEHALAATADFEPLGMGAVLTCLGESVDDVAHAERVASHYHGVIDSVAARGLDTRISVKLTQLGMDLDDAMAVHHLRQLAARAADYDNEVWVDMEYSTHVDRTLAIFRAVAAEHRNVGICLQAYLHRTPGDLETLLQTTAAVRLVKGAYDEPAAIALRRRRDVDAAFQSLALRLLAGAREHADSPLPVLASHDTRLLGAVRDAHERAGGHRSDYEIQMLYGIRTREQRALAAAGHRVRVLISYGSAWFPWFMRRLAERPANVVFVARNLLARA